MADHAYDYDWQSVYPSIIKPMCGRGSGKSQAQLQLYEAILKRENNIHVKELEKWAKKNLVKAGVDLGADKICDATLQGENDMDNKESL